MAQPEPRLIAFYRADVRARMWRVLLVGPGALTSGGLVISLSFLGRPRSVLVEAALVGFVLIAGGAVYTLLGMHRILREDSFLALRTDGVVVQSAAGPHQAFIAWDDLSAARWDEARAALVLERSGEPPLPPLVVAQPFARVTGAELAACITATKRKIAMNLLR
jgi:hypothetical protein